MIGLLLLLFAQFTVPMHTGATAVAPATGIAYVTTCDSGGSGVTSDSCTVTGVPAGSTILFMATGSSAAVSGTDSAGGTVSQIGTNQTWDVGSEVANLWYVANASAGTHTLTAHFAGSVNFTRFQVMVFSGANTSSPIDTSAIAAGSGTAASSGNMTTANANEMLVGFIVGASATGITPGSPPTFILVQAGTGVYFAAEYAIAGTTGSYAATAGLTPSVQWVVLTAALKQ